mmetsp:Transcript_41366/g.107153  ORF Transcript_41366/g.107153 Transcript_41366/m.107153 type:complete len:124 (+) Transcript_41366:868-1239(+)
MSVPTCVHGYHSLFSLFLPFFSPFHFSYLFPHPLSLFFPSPCLCMCACVQVLYMSNNVIKSWAELERLKELENLQEVLLVGNPIWKTHDEAGDWKMQVRRGQVDMCVWMKAVEVGCVEVLVRW